MKSLITFLFIVLASTTYRCGKDEETMCAEYKVSSVEIQKISNQFKTDHYLEESTT